MLSGLAVAGAGASQPLGLFTGHGSVISGGALSLGTSWGSVSGTGSGFLFNSASKPKS